MTKIVQSKSKATNIKPSAMNSCKLELESFLGSPFLFCTLVTHFVIDDTVLMLSVLVVFALIYSVHLSIVVDLSIILLCFNDSKIGRFFLLLTFAIATQFHPPLP